MNAPARTVKAGQQLAPALPQDSAVTDEATFLGELGQRVRHQRQLHGMSRKVLAKTSGISERYLAQLETGSGNVSIILLRRAAAAMACPLEELVGSKDSLWREWREILQSASPAALAEARTALLGKALTAGPPGINLSRRIALIGLRGAGKSTLGRLAAEQLGWNFVELNKEIAADKGFSVAEIFSLYGQDGYRRQEQKSLQKIIAAPGPMILATGGGIVAEAQTYQTLLAHFLVIWVKASPQDHMDRVRQQGDLRPMANDRAAMSELTSILASRAPLYARAPAVLDTSSAALPETLDRLVALIKSFEISES